MTVTCYVRISTPEQNPELQLRELQDYATRQGWELADAYQDVGSGSNACRPGLDRLMEDAREGRFKVVLVWKLDRFGRSLVDCLKNIELLEGCGIRFIAVTQGLDTDHKNPASRFLLQVLGAAAEFERSLILERVQAGQARYRQDYQAGRVGRTVHSRSGKDLPGTSTKEDFRQGEGGPTSPRRTFSASDCRHHRYRPSHCLTDAAGAFQKLKRNCACGKLIPSELWKPKSEFWVRSQSLK